MNKVVLLSIAVLIVTVSCQPAPMPTLASTPVPSTSTAIPPTSTLILPTLTPLPTATPTPVPDPLLPTPSSNYPAYGYLGKEVGEVILRRGVMDGITFSIEGKRCYAPSSALVEKEIQFGICPTGSSSRVTGYEFLGKPGPEKPTKVTLTYEDSSSVKQGYNWKWSVTIAIAFDSKMTEEEKAMVRTRLRAMFIKEGIRGEIDAKNAFFDSSTQTLYSIGEYGKLEPFKK